MLARWGEWVVTKIVVDVLKTIQVDKKDGITVPRFTFLVVDALGKPFC